MKRALLAVLTLAVIATYTARSFVPHTLLHHELNDAGGALLISLLLVFVFFPGRGDDE